MDKLHIWVLAVWILILLSGCGGSGQQDNSIQPSEPPAASTYPTEISIPETTCPAPVETTVPETESTALPTELPTQPPQAESLCIPGVSVEDVILYFNEICLDAEFVNSGDPSVLQKWDIPLRYELRGTYTQEDLDTLSDFCQWLNTVEGFPGIQESDSIHETNLVINFDSYEEMISLMGDQFAGCDGAVTFHYADNAIYLAIICCRNDIPQTLRNSVILEEIYNGLGPIQDTSLREDSIIYAGYSEPQQLTEIDKLILKLLYHPGMKCGMTAAECEAVIRELYR